eukprot:TRINITY_DN29858_c0_g1_i1.p1 TRINITY_DN29858_c0_g1~~TRINITY_DN29858_c0_g1_i1.p1  ORF type:complete len:320 (-),score=78.24 TRINITY_DN29858_c0_g1_i1:224-1183(-)
MCLHITAVVSRYAGVVKGWDVVNEAIEQEGSLRKWGVIHPELDRYAWEDADAFIKFATEEAKADYVLGHALIWHRNVPDWLFEIGNDRDSLLEIMCLHITAVVSRYAGVVKGWDVVNEAIEQEGSLRDSPWRSIIGDDYVEKAFEFAHAADPEAELFYNDHNLEWHPKKLERTVQLIEELRSKGLRVDGVGMQGHWKLSWPSLKDIENSIVTLKSAGVRVCISELDVDVIPKEAKEDVYKQGLPEVVQDQLAKRYAELFKLFVKHQDCIDRVSFWAPTDKYSWLNLNKGDKRTNHPVLFDRRARPKKCFHSVMKALDSS